MSSADRSFVTSAAEANLAEIDSAKVVEREAHDPAVKEFAARMISDHTQANQKLAGIAGTALPTQPSATERSHQGELQKLSGSNLDHTYLADELTGHKQVISEFENEIENGHDPAVKNYAEQTLPSLQDHIRIAEDVAGKMGMSGKAGLSDEAKAIASR
jgi:putative membrane protein